MALGPNGAQEGATRTARIGKKNAGVTE